MCFSFMQVNVPGSDWDESGSSGGGRSGSQTNGGRFGARSRMSSGQSTGSGGWDDSGDGGEKRSFGGGRSSGFGQESSGFGARGGSSGFEVKSSGFGKSSGGAGGKWLNNMVCKLTLPISIFRENY